MRRTVLVGALAALACADAPTTDSRVPVVRVTVSPASDSVFVGASLQATAATFDPGGRPVAAAVSWTTSDDHVAVVDGSGIVRGVAPGAAHIVARSDRAADTADVRVLAPVASVTIQPDTLRISLGYAGLLQVTLRDASGAALTGRAIRWSVRDTAVAGVSRTGSVYGVAPGATRIAAEVEGRSDSATVDVVAVPFAIAVVSSADSAPLGSVVSLTATVRDARDTIMPGAPVVWDAVNPLFGDVDSLGRLRVRSGSAVTIRARSGGATGTVTVTGYAQGASVVSSSDHGCLLTLTGHVACWGHNTNGQLGVLVATISFDYTHYSLTLIDTMRFAALGQARRDHQCAVTAAGAAWCWGGNSFGQLGRPPDGTTCYSNTGCGLPGPVAGGHAFQVISAGGYHTCALDAAGAAWCWGSGGSGELGSGPTTNSSAPVAVQGGHQFVQIGAGWSFSCGLDTAGVAWCWGGNQYGALGDSSTTNRSSPVTVAGGHRFTRVAVGASHACALDATGTVWCWGYDVQFQIGPGTATTCAGLPCLPYPAAVPSATPFADVGAGGTFSCGLTGSWQAWCWGASRAFTAPARTGGTLTYDTLGVGYSAVCGRATDGILYCAAPGGPPVRVPGQR